jgi:membrane protein YqaA with SNARE-associated domain
VNIRLRHHKQGYDWVPVIIFGCGVAALAVLYHFWPGKNSLLLFGMYTIPSHILISPFPHEPMLLWVAKFEPPWTVAIMGTIGACLAGLFDYGLLVPLFSHYAVRSRYEGSGLYLRSLRFFKRFPFGFLVVAGFSPLPFFPFKFISIAGGYPLWKYQTALVVGRTPRYYLLAWLGKEFHFPDWLLVFLALILFISATANIFRRFVFGGQQERAVQAPSPRGPVDKSKRSPAPPLI